jgi:hypothetical protein
MTLVNLKPNNRQLRQFGWVSTVGFLVILGVLGAKLSWFAPSLNWFIISLFIAASAFSAIFAAFFPKGLLPLYFVMVVVGAPIGFVVGNVILILLFATIFVPVGLFFRLIGRDELKLKRDHRAESYWLEVPAQVSAASYFRQY